MRVLVCGDRNWPRYSVIRKRLEKLPEDTIIVHGCARGADRIAGAVAKELGFKVEKFPADWKHYGKAAGPIRNKKMLKEGKPDLVLAFHSNLSASRGTKHMVTIARKAGVEVEVITGILQVYTSSYQYKGPDRLDITVKTGDRDFAPSWEMVRQYKSGCLSQKEYIKQYYQRMRRSFRKNRSKWDDLLDRQKVVLVCFCPPGEFCHRLILAEILEKLGAEYKGEMRDEHK